jgi:Cyclin, N-terminal domain
LIQVHTCFRLLLETLYVAVNIIDRFLSACVVSFAKLQLVGITCMFLKACWCMLHAVIGTRTSVDKFRDTLEEESTLMLRRLVDKPKNFVGPVRKYVPAQSPFVKSD